MNMESGQTFGQDFLETAFVAGQAPPWHLARVLEVAGRNVHRLSELSSDWCLQDGVMTRNGLF